MNRKIVSGEIVVLSILAVIAMAATASAQPAPEGFVIAGLVNNYCTGESVNNADVTVKNLNTSEVFSTGTGQLFWWANYRFTIPSDGVSAGNVLHIASDNGGNSTEGNYTVTQEDIFYSGFKQDITIGVCGEVDCDGSVLVNTDAMKVFRRAIHQEPVDCEWGADVDCDGSILVNTDAMKVFRRAVHHEPLNCCIG